MKKSILVIGATGNVGRVLIKRLVTKGEQVKAATRTPERYAAQANVVPVYFDYHQPETFASALEGVDRVFAIGIVDTRGIAPFAPFVKQAQHANVQQIALISGVPILLGDGRLHHMERIENPAIAFRYSLYHTTPRVVHAALPGWISTDNDQTEALLEFAGWGCPP